MLKLYAYHTEQSSLLNLSLSQVLLAWTFFPGTFVHHSHILTYMSSSLIYLDFDHPRRSFLPYIICVKKEGLISFWVSTAKQNSCLPAFHFLQWWLWSFYFVFTFENLANWKTDQIATPLKWFCFFFSFELQIFDVWKTLYAAWQQNLEGKFPPLQRCIYFKRPGRLTRLLIYR